MKVWLRRLLPATLFLIGGVIGAVLAAKRADKDEAKAAELDENAGRLKVNNNLRAAAEESQRAMELRGMAAQKRRIAETRIGEVTKDAPTLTAVLDAFNSGVRERTGAKPVDGA